MKQSFGFQLAWRSTAVLTVGIEAVIETLQDRGILLEQ